MLKYLKMYCLFGVKFVTIGLFYTCITEEYLVRNVICKTPE